MEERRLLLAIALSLLVLTGYQLLFPPPPPVEPAEGGPGVEAAEGQEPAGVATPPEPSEPAQPAATPAPTPTPEVPRIADGEERRIEIRTDRIEVGLTNRGGEVLSWKLLDYTDRDGRPEEMVQTYPDGWLPLALETGDADLDARLRTVLFEPSETQVRVERDGSATVTLRYADGEVEVEKALRFRGNSYLTGVSARLRRDGEDRPVRVLWGPGISNATEAEREVRGYAKPSAVLLAPDGDVERHAAGDLEDPLDFAGAAWAGVESQYFTALWIPQSGALQGRMRGIEIPADPSEDARREPQTGVQLDEGRSVELYVGPKDYFALQRIDENLARVVPVGDWIGPIVVPLMRLLKWVHGHLGNYGWSIVVLTILINLVMAPLRHFSIANGIKMAKLSPEMKVIQERYRKVPALDPKRQEMQKEVAALYARHGMSMSTQLTVGCLPLLLTMPFLIAFYRMLQMFIELRGAEFLWIPDLSQKDPLFITPVLMGASMFLMQRMMPSSMDPAQQRMMMVMPLVLLGMFLWAPSGLNLYWLSANVCSIVQQGTTLRILKARGEGPAATGGKPSAKSSGKPRPGKGKRR